MKIKCRGATEEDVPEIFAVVQSAFGPERAGRFDIAMKKRIEKYEDVRLACNAETGEIIGVCPIYYYPTYFGPERIESGGLSMFGVRKDQQRKGIGQIVLEDCNLYLEKEGYDVNFLFTGSPDFYRHKGYEMGYLDPKYSIDADKIESFVSDFIWKPLQKSNVEDVADLYEKFNKNFPKTRIRDILYWNRRIEANPGMKTQIQCLFQNNHIIAYFWWGVRTINTESMLEILEYAIDPNLEPLDILKIENIILSKAKEYANDSQAKKIDVKLFETYGLVQNIIRNGGIDVSPYWDGFMVVILNLQQFLHKFQNYLIWFYQKRQVRIEKLKEFGEINVKVEEFIIKFKFKENISIDIIPTTKSEKFTDLINLIEMPRKYLGVVVFGNIQPSELVESNMWSCDENYLDVLDEIFPKMYGVVYPMDGF